MSWSCFINNRWGGTTTTVPAMKGLVRPGWTSWSIFHLRPTVDQKKMLATYRASFPFSMNHLIVLYWERLIRIPVKGARKNKEVKKSIISQVSWYPQCCLYTALQQWLRWESMCWRCRIMPFRMSTSPHSCCALGMWLENGIMSTIQVSTWR